MKKGYFASFFSWLNLSLVVTLTIFGLSQLKISKIECSLDDKPCSDEILDQLETYKGKHFVAFDFESEVQSKLNSHLVTLVKTKIPNSLVVNLKSESKYMAHTNNETELEGWENKQTTLDDLLTILDEKKINPTKITLKDSQTITLKFDQLQAVLNPEEMNLQVNRLELILNNLDLETIDLAIKEIDVRYKLPVLRTEYSV